jgi:hypothetical protein
MGEEKGRGGGRDATGRLWGERRTCTWPAEVGAAAKARIGNARASNSVREAAVAARAMRNIFYTTREFIDDDAGAGKKDL